MKDLFVDRLINISVWQGVARLDFARVDDVNPEDKKVNMSASLSCCDAIGCLSGTSRTVIKSHS